MARRRPLFESLEARLCMAAPTLQVTFPLPSAGSWTPTVYRASPLFVDIFNTGKDDLISVTAGAELVAYAEKPDGTARVDVVYQVPGGVADIKSTPIVVTDPRNGQKDLFAAMGRDEGHSGTLEDGRVFGWNLQTGQLLPGWTQGQSTGHNSDGLSGVYGALTSGQLEGNGVPSIVATSFSHTVTAFRLDGSTLWQWTNDDTILSGAAIGDIDRDGHQEVVVGGDSSNSAFFQAGGWVNVLSDTGILKWRKFIPGEVTWSSPVLADLQNNGNLDVVIGTGLNYQAQNFPGAQVLGDRIYALDPFGNILPGWPYATTPVGNTVPHEVLAAPAVADLLGNGQLDVVALDRAGFIHAISPTGQDLPGFQGGKSLAPNLSLLLDDYASPIIADINGDGKPEIIGAFGPFLSAFDTAGNLFPIATTIMPPGGSPEGIDAAPAVGNFNGTLGLSLAFVSYNAQAGNRPDQVNIFRLPPSTLAPPWPLLRRTASGDAVERSAVFDHQYVAAAFNTILGVIPPQAVLQPYDDLLDSNTLSLRGTALNLAGSPIARQTEVQRIFLGLLGRPATSSDLTTWTNLLATITYRQMEVAIASTPEFAQRAGNNLSQEYVLLYRSLLLRSPSPAELNNLIAANTTITNLAIQIVNGREEADLLLNAIYPRAIGLNAIPIDAEASYAYDIQTGVREELILANILASGGNYAATNTLAGYVEDVYRDVLHRNASPTEVAIWINAFGNGSASVGTFAPFILNTPEARAGYVQSEFLALLGHPADASTVAALQNYANRESVVIFIVGSPEYFTRNGGTNAGFVAAAFRDLGGIAIDPGNLNAFVAKMNAGLSTTGVAQQIIYGGSLYFANTIVNEVQSYLPNEQLGVLRSGNLPPTAPGQPINPDPNLLNYLMGLQAQGFTDEQIIGVLLTSPTYFSRVAYFKGIRRSPGVRF
jgi:hypothetical protein